MIKIHPLTNNVWHHKDYFKGQLSYSFHSVIFCLLWQIHDSNHFKWYLCSTIFFSAIKLHIEITYHSSRFSRRRLGPSSDSDTKLSRRLGVFTSSHETLIIPYIKFYNVKALCKILLPATGKSLKVSMFNTWLQYD